MQPGEVGRKDPPPGQVGGQVSPTALPFPRFGDGEHANFCSMRSAMQQQVAALGDAGRVQLAERSGRVQGELDVGGVGAEPTSQNTRPSTGEIPRNSGGGAAPPSRHR